MLSEKSLVWHDNIFETRMALFIRTVIATDSDRFVDGSNPCDEPYFESGSNPYDASRKTAENRK